MRREEEIQKPEGKLGVLIPGMGGAVSTTFLAGVESVRQNLALPIGSVSQMGTVRLGKRFEYRIPFIKDFVPLAHLDDLVFGGWDVFPDNGYQAAVQAGVLNRDHLDPVRSFLEALQPWPAVFKQAYVKNPDVTVQDLLHDIMAKTGENISVRRFIRYQLGESDER